VAAATPAAAPHHSLAGVARVQSRRARLESLGRRLRRRTATLVVVVVVAQSGECSRRLLCERRRRRLDALRKFNFKKTSGRAALKSREQQ